MSALQGSAELKGACDAVALGRGGDLSGLTPPQLGALRKRLAFFLSKFPKVGTLRGEEVLLP